MEARPQLHTLHLLPPLENINRSAESVNEGWISLEDELRAPCCLLIGLRPFMIIRPKQIHGIESLSVFHELNFSFSTPSSTYVKDFMDLSMKQSSLLEDSSSFTAETVLWLLLCDLSYSTPCQKLLQFMTKLALNVHSKGPALFFMFVLLQCVFLCLRTVHAVAW